MPLCLEAKTIPKLFDLQSDAVPDRPLLYFKDIDYRTLTWKETRESVDALAAYWIERGIQAQDRILILSENRYEWGITDLAALACGAVTVPVYPTLTASELRLILQDCSPKAAMVSTMEQFDKLRSAENLLKPESTLIIEPDHEHNALRWRNAIHQGYEHLAAHKAELHTRKAHIRETDLATLIYTSGTTGEPKGVMLSHKNLLSNASACLRIIPIREEDTHLSFLPLSHVFERMAGWYLMLMAGARVAYAESMVSVPENMLEVKPTVMLGVPRFFEKLHARIHDRVALAPRYRRRLFFWAVEVGTAMGYCRLNKLKPTRPLRIAHFIASKLIFKKVHERLGGRLRFFVSGSAPLNRNIAEFFFAVGVTILEGYGLTETSPVIAVNTTDALRFGSVGQPLEGLQVKIAEDGEILTRGPHVMQGYYLKPEATAEVIRNGWLHTGDIGHLDPDGYLHITDRKKDLIKTSGGKFVAPQKLEGLFIAEPFIAQAVVLGDRRPYCIALIVPDREKALAWAAEHNIDCADYETLLARREFRNFLWERIEERQKELPRYEQIKKMALLAEEFSQENGELTPTMKAKRKVILDRCRALIEETYASPA